MTWNEHDSVILLEIEVVQFTLRFSMHTKKFNFDIGNSRYREKTTKNNIRESVGSTKFGK